MPGIKQEKKIIGRIEKVNFPEFHMHNIDAKIDTGAYTSSIHCHDIEEHKKGRTSILYFKLLDPSHPSYNQKKLCFKDFSEKKVKNSFGQVEKRYRIKTKVSLGGKIYTTEFTLSDRSDMRFPVLLGRKILSKRFLVDPSKQNLLSRKANL